jgi:hypothetical protein
VGAGSRTALRSQRGHEIVMRDSLNFVRAHYATRMTCLQTRKSELSGIEALFQMKDGRLSEGGDIELPDAVWRAM